MMRDQSHPTKRKKAAKILGALTLVPIATAFIGAVVIFCLVAFAGHSTKKYQLCSKMNDIVLDFDDPNLRGIYSQKIKHWVTWLKLKGKDQYYGCLDNMSDSLANQCLSMGGYQDYQYMKGKWKLVNDGYYTDPYGIHLGGNTKIYFVGLKQDDKVVYAPIFTFANLYPPLHDVFDRDGKSEYLKKICDEK